MKLSSLRNWTVFHVKKSKYAFLSNRKWLSYCFLFLDVPPVVTLKSILMLFICSLFIPSSVVHWEDFYTKTQVTCIMHNVGYTKIKRGRSTMMSASLETKITYSNENFIKPFGLNNDIKWQHSTTGVTCTSSFQLVIKRDV